MVMGGYVLTKPLPTRIRCKVYDRPPGFGGRTVATLEPGVYVGPILDLPQWSTTSRGESFFTICIPWPVTPSEWGLGYMNVWSDAKGAAQFARMVPWSEVQAWQSRGWWHRHL